MNERIDRLFRGFCDLMEHLLLTDSILLYAAQLFFREDHLFGSCMHQSVIVFEQPIHRSGDFASAMRNIGNIVVECPQAFPVVLG